MKAINFTNMNKLNADNFFMAGKFEQAYVAMKRFVNTVRNQIFLHPLITENQKFTLNNNLHAAEATLEKCLDRLVEAKLKEMDHGSTPKATAGAVAASGL